MSTPSARVTPARDLARAHSQALSANRHGRGSDPTMAFSDDVRNELAAIAPRKECDRLAELSALFHSAGSLHLRGRGEVSLHLDVASSAVARRAFTLLRAFRVRSE